MLITNDKERRRLKLDLSSTPSPQAFRALPFVSSDIHPWVRRTTGEVHCDPKLRIEKGFDDILCCRRFDSPSRDEGFSGITVTTALGKAFGMPKDISNYLCEIGVSNSYQTIRRRGQKDFARRSY
jgi:hypothetical protein